MYFTQNGKLKIDLELVSLVEMFYGSIPSLQLLLAACRYPITHIAFLQYR